MLHCEHNSQQDRVKFVRRKLEKATSAMLYSLFDQSKAPFSELRVRYKIVLDHVERRFAQVNDDLLEIASQIFTKLLEHSGKKHQNLRVSSVWIIHSIIFYKALQSWEELLVENLIVICMLNIGLNELENVSSDSLHWLYHVLVLSEFH